MNTLNKALEEFALNPNDAAKCWNLAVLYDLEGQTASASTFFLKCAERSSRLSDQYYSLIRCALCYDKQGDRGHTVITLLKHAISVQPNRPEAFYLLARSYERKKEYVDCYTWASIGKSLPQGDDNPSIQYVNYGCLFEMAVSAWHWGKGKEARMLFQELMDLKLDEAHYKAVEWNVKWLGAGPNTDKDYSQAGQDFFVLEAFNNKRNGIA